MVVVVVTARRQLAFIDLGIKLYSTEKDTSLRPSMENIREYGMPSIGQKVMGQI